jgi:hypothetical protein
MLSNYVEQTSHSVLQLNLSHQERYLTTLALQHTLHPSAFRLIEHSVSRILLQESYPKFLATTYANCNNARVKFAYALGGFVLLAGFMCFLLLSLSKHSRKVRLLGFPIFALGVCFTYSAFYGVCPVLQGFGIYQIKPWEVEDSDDEGESSKGDIEEGARITGGSGSDEWIRTYNTKNAFLHIFDPDTKVYNERIRKGQLIVNCQGAVLGVIVSAIVTTLFMLIPPGKYY